MTKSNPFTEKARMRRIAEQSPPKEALGIIETLQGLGFSWELPGSDKYVLAKIQALSDQDRERARQAFKTQPSKVHEILQLALAVRGETSIQKRNGLPEYQ